MRGMVFLHEEREVSDKRQQIFLTLKTEGLKMTKNKYITEEDVDRMWNE